MTLTEAAALPACEAPHVNGYTIIRDAAFDLGRYVRVVGLPGEVRFLCADCARGRIAYRFDERFPKGRRLG